MPIIYEPKGAAREYAALSANLWKGCGHACVYCYAPGATLTKRAVFSSPGYIRHRPGAIDQLRKDAKKFSGDPRNVLLSFTSDLYQPAEQREPIAREALAILRDNNVKFTVLTKGGTMAIRDFDLYSEGCEFACTITTDDPVESTEWEPGAASPSDRIEALKIAHDAGIKTWVSFEPVFNPAAVLRIIPKIAKFVDLFKVGKLNYHPEAKTIDWSDFLRNVEAKLRECGKEFIIKESLEAHR